MTRRSFAGWLTCTIAIAALSGCEITIGDGNGNGNGGGDEPTSITVRIVNTSNVSLDPQIYVAAAAVTTDELLGDANKFTRFGVGNLGLIGANGSDSFTLNCSDVRVLGTRGGAFGDDLTAPDGNGRQLVVTQDLQFFCGDRITFTFSRSSGGFTTTFDID